MSAIKATWSISIDCECPACGEYFDMTRTPDFWDGKGTWQLAEHDTNRTTGVEAICPKCDHEFLVDLVY